MKEVDIAIVGAGPGGLAAALESSRAGAGVVVLDENPEPGGQIWRTPGAPEDFSSLPSHHRHKAARLFLQLKDQGSHIEWVHEALVWGVFQGNTLAYSHQGRSEEIRSRRLILATGAYDRAVPFPGWTLPGVFTAGGAQRLLKDHGVLPGNRILLAGTGPLQLALASQILRADGKIAAILESGWPESYFRLALAFLAERRILFEGLGYLKDILQAGLWIRQGHIVVEARGDGRVEEAVVSRVDRDWRPLPHTRKTIAVDAICLGYGLLPSTELGRLIGAEHVYSIDTGAWVPQRNENMEMSVPGFFSVGDGAEVAGSEVALLEGHIAGIRAASDLGLLSRRASERMSAPFKLRLKRLKRFRREMDAISRPRSGLFNLAKPETILCRCEEITLGEIMTAIQQGAIDINQLKRFTRAGMGACQGRMCGQFLGELIRQVRKERFPAFLATRPPVRPVPLGWLGVKETEEQQSRNMC